MQDQDGWIAIEQESPPLGVRVELKRVISSPPQPIMFDPLVYGPPSRYEDLDTRVLLSEDNLVREGWQQWRRVK